MRSDVLIVGGGFGGVAAALAALRRDRTVVMTEPTAWIGGQATSQATPFDEHPWIEEGGASASYRELRDGIRRWYRRQPLTPQSQANPTLNPGNSAVSPLAAEPVVVHEVLCSLLEPWLRSGALRILLHASPVGATVQGDSITSVTVAERESGRMIDLAAPIVIDATELGELLPLAGVEYVTGAESHAMTGEPHAPVDADPTNEQAFSWVAALSYEHGADHTIDRPRDYETWKQLHPVIWPDSLLSLTYPNPRTLLPVTAVFDPSRDDRNAELDSDQRFFADPELWSYRRVRWRHHFDDGRPDISVLNWPMNDYFLGRLIDVSAEDAERAMDGARELTLSLVHWLQVEAPRPDGGTGWPGLRLAPEAVGSTTGLALAPYVRESRRIVARRTIVEQDLALDVRGEHGAVLYPDSVGIGSYRIDLHPTTTGDTYLDIPSAPFSIPLAALVPVRMRNLIAAAKNIGTTHITNGCYRLHPVEWAIGEAAGALAALCVDEAASPHDVADSTALTEQLQSDLVRGGATLSWPSWAVGY